MATEKQLLSRIQLRYDTYANWSSTSLGDGRGANLVLKKGEIGLCSIPSGTTVDGVQNPPHVMFKVGDGTSVFSALPWASARAADVYAWAKQASLPVTKEGDGNVVTGIAWDEATKGIKFTTAKMATSDEMTSLSNRVKTIEDTYATDNDLSAAVEAINDAIDLKADKTYVDTKLDKKVNNSDFATFQTNNTAAIGTAKSEAIADAEGKINALANGAVKNNTDAITAIKDGTTIDSFADVETAIGNIVVDTLTTGSDNGTVAFNGSDVAVKGLGSAAYTESSAYATSAQGAKADSAVQSVSIATGSANGKVKLTVDGNDTEASVYGLGSAAYTESSAYDAAGSAKAVQDNLDAYETSNDQAVAEVKATADSAKASIDAFLKEADTTTDAVDTLKEIQAQLDAGDASAASLLAEINKIKDGTTTVPSATNAAQLGGVVAENYALKSDLTNGNVVAAKAEVASGLDETGVAQVKGIKVDNAGHADSADSAADADKLGGVAAADYATKAYADQAEADALAAAKEYANGLAGDYATSKQGAKADTAVQSATFAGTAMTKTGTELAISQADARTALGLGSAAYTASSDYATAAQGALADTALQKADITTGSTDGTIAVEGTDVAVAGLKSAAYTEASAYATAEQGTKADSALQSVEVGTGLKVSAKASNKQTVEIDEDVVFVLYGGSASEVI